MVTNNLVIGLFVINTYKRYGQEHIADDKFLTAVGSVSSVFGGLRFVWSYIVDRWSFKLSYSIALCMNVFFGFTLTAIVDIPALYLIWISMIIWAEGAHFSLVPAACAKFFGRHAPTVYGIAFSFGMIPQLCSTIMVRFWLKEIRYESFYYMASAASLLALCICLFLFEEKKYC